MGSCNHWHSLPVPTFLPGFTANSMANMFPRIFQCQLRGSNSRLGWHTCPVILRRNHTKYVLCMQISNNMPKFSTSSTHLNKETMNNHGNKVDIGPGTWQEVYHGVLATQIKMVKTFSLSTTLIGLAFQPILIQKASDTNLGLVVAMGSFIGFFTFVTPMLIHWITRKYVT